MKLAFLTLATIAIVFALTEFEYESQFADFVRNYERTYKKGDEEYSQRFQYFKQNLDFVNSHNSDESKSFRCAINQFGDWSRAEYLSILHRNLPKEEWTPSDNFESSIVAKQNLPTSWDWTKKGAVTAVKDQLQCGSSPYFAAVVSVEGCYFLDSGMLKNFSAQQIVDCSANEGNAGCNGGEMNWALQSIVDDGGIDTESCYPYVGVTGESCKFNKKPPCCGCTIESYVDVSPNEEALQLAVYQVPVASAMDSSQSSFEFYSSGVYWDPNCSNQTDHGIAVVGWGVTPNGTDYWILKNSWGPTFGINGYVWLARNKNDMCGIAVNPSYAVGCYPCVEDD